MKLRQESKLSNPTAGTVAFYRVLLIFATGKATSTAFLRTAKLKLSLLRFSAFDSTFGPTFCQTLKRFTRVTKAQADVSIQLLFATCSKFRKTATNLFPVPSPHLPQTPSLHPLSGGWSDFVVFVREVPFLFFCISRCTPCGNLAGEKHT